jgi:hypothetical protein
LPATTSQRVFVKVKVRGWTDKPPMFQSVHRGTMLLKPRLNLVGRWWSSAASFSTQPQSAAGNGCVAAPTSAFIRRRSRWQGSAPPAAAAPFALLHRGVGSLPPSSKEGEPEPDESTRRSSVAEEGGREKSKLIPAKSDLNRLWGLTSHEERRNIYAAVGLLAISTGVTGCVPLA